MTTPNRQMLCEFPEPVVTAYFKQIGDLPEALFAAAQSPAAPASRQLDASDNAVARSSRAAAVGRRHVAATDDASDWDGRM